MIHSTTRKEYAARVVGGVFDGKQLLADVIISTKYNGSRLTLETGGEFGRVIGTVWGNEAAINRNLDVLQHFIEDIRQAVVEGSAAISEQAD